MSCSQPSEGRELELALWAGGDCPAAEASRLEQHLAACAECRALAQGLRESQAGLAELAGEPIDPEALARVRTGVLRRLEERRPRPAVAPWLMAAAATLAVAALALGLWLQGSRPAGTPEVAARAEDASPISAAGPARARPVPEDRGIDAAPRRAEERTAAAAPKPGPDPAVPAPGWPQETEQSRRASRETAVPEAPPVQRAAVPPAEPSATESMVIQIVSDDPDIVFYWLVEPEENEDEAISS
jgi:cytoskeletal protein RodZ